MFQQWGKLREASRHEMQGRYLVKDGLRVNVVSVSTALDVLKEISSGITLSFRNLDKRAIFARNSLEWRSMRLATWLPLLVLLATPGRSGSTAKCQSLLHAEDRIGGTSLQGKTIALHQRGDSAVVLFFLASDCPISNRYLPEMNRITAEFRDRGVRAWFVYPNVTETEAGIRHHQALYAEDKGDLSNVLMDAHQQLATRAGAHVTPEAAVLVEDKGELRSVYTGRIDDRYLNLGTERPQAGRHDLEQAIGAVLAHQPVAPPGGPPVGCGIVDRQ